MDDNFGVAAGWYPDPLGLPQLRWWDSQAWTEHTSEARAPIVVHPTTLLGFADDDEEQEFRTPVHEEEFLSRREQRARERRENGDLLQSSDMQIEVGTEQTQDAGLGLDVDADNQELSAQPLLAMTLRELEPPLTDTVDDATPGPRRASSHANALPMESLLSALAEDLPAAAEEAPARVIKKMKTYTLAVWAIALMPLLQVLALILFVTVLQLGSNWPLVIATIVVPYFVVIGLALYDRLELQVRGHSNPASGLWAILTAPAYLVVRAIRTYRQSGRGFAPLVVFLQAGITVLVGILVVPGILIAALPGPFADEAAQSAQSTALSIGGKITLACPAPPLAIGDTFACIATKASGETDSVSIALERENGWIAWRVKDWGSWTLSD